MRKDSPALRAALAVILRLARDARKDVADGVACFAGLAAALEAIRTEAARAEALAADALEDLDDEAEPAA